MKLLSRFIWLILFLSIIVIGGITLVKVKADKEFGKIKNSITQEYDAEIDQMITRDFYGVDFTNYLATTANDVETSFFILNNNSNDRKYIDSYLGKEMLEYAKFEAVWFLKDNGETFYFKSTNGTIVRDFLPIPSNALEITFIDEGPKTFYQVINGKVIRFVGARITTGGISNTVGYIIAAAIQDDQWLNYYSANINNSKVSIMKSMEELPSISREIVRITRPLNDYFGNPVAVMNIELDLPFLNLWNSTASTNNKLIIGSLLLTMLIFLIFVISWVIAPIKKISESLSNGRSTEIQSLKKSKTEMGVVARLIDEYHAQTEQLKETDKMKTFYLENLSHKVRTPMNAIIGFINLLIEEDLEEDVRDTYISIISKDTEKLIGSVDEIIEILKKDDTKK